MGRQVLNTWRLATVTNDIKQRIQKERRRVVVAANQGMVVYWDLGRMILDRHLRRLSPLSARARSMQARTEK